MEMNIVDLGKKLITKLVADRMTNRRHCIDGAEHGLEVLHEALTQLQRRLIHTETIAVQQEAMVMREAVGDVIALAYSNFPVFSDRWELKIYYNEGLTTSNIFVFYFNEKKGERQYHFRFSGLKNNS